VIRGIIKGQRQGWDCVKKGDQFDWAGGNKLEAASLGYKDDVVE
jgi:hypothetical protein